MIPNKVPDKWHLRVVFAISITLGCISCLSSLLLLYFSLTSNQEGSFFQNLKLGGLTYGQIIAGLFLKIAVSDHLTIYSARSEHRFMWNPKVYPSKKMMMSSAIGLLVSSLLALLWPASSPDEVVTKGLVYSKPYAFFVYIWLYCLVFWVIQVMSIIVITCFPLYYIMYN